MQAQEQKYHHGIMFICLSALNLSLFGLFVKLGTERIPYLFLTFLRFLVPFLMLLPFLIGSGSFKGFVLFKGAKNQFLRCFFVLLVQYTIFYYLTKGTLLNATVLLNTGPLFIPLLERLFFKHPIEKSTWISLIIALAGVICILQPGQDLFSLLSLVGLLAGFGQGGSQVLYGHNVKNERNDINLFYLFFLGMLFSFIPVLVSDVFIKKDLVFISTEFIRGGFKPIVYLLALSIATIGNQAFRGLAYRHGRPSHLSPFLYSSVLFSGLLDWTVLGNEPNFLSAIGALLVILGGVVQVYLKK